LARHTLDLHKSLISCSQNHMSLPIFNQSFMHHITFWYDQLRESLYFSFYDSNHMFTSTLSPSSSSASSCDFLTVGQRSLLLQSEMNRHRRYQEACCLLTIHLLFLVLNQQGSYCNYCVVCVFMCVCVCVCVLLDCRNRPSSIQYEQWEDVLKICHYCWEYENDDPQQRTSRIYLLFLNRTGS
jgi:hypothetical protein